MQWLDRIVEHPKRFAIIDNGDGTYTLDPRPGNIVQEGTPVNAVNMNSIENRIESHLLENASQTNLGHVKVDGETITASNGIISAQTQIVDTVTSDKWKWGMEDGIVFLEKVVV
jgi:hypothetical protein